MKERCQQIPHKKIYLTIFILCGFVLTIFYYDNSVLNAAAPYATEEITLSVRNETIFLKTLFNQMNLTIPKTSPNAATSLAFVTHRSYNNSTTLRTVADSFRPTEPITKKPKTKKIVTTISSVITKIPKNISPSTSSKNDTTTLKTVAHIFEPKETVTKRPKTKKIVEKIRPKETITKTSSTTSPSTTSKSKSKSSSKNNIFISLMKTTKLYTTTITPTSLQNIAATTLTVNSNAINRSRSMSRKPNNINIKESKLNQVFMTTTRSNKQIRHTTTAGSVSTKTIAPNLLSKTEETTSATTTTTINTNSKYLISNPKCKIPNLEPFNADAKRFYKKNKYKSCSAKKLLTYVKVTDNIATLYVDKRMVPSYSKKGVTCCYSNITRVNYDKDPDRKVKLSTCHYFENQIKIYNPPVHIKCLNKKSRKQIYENVHSTTLINDAIQEKINNFDNSTNSTKPFSVLFVGIDSISRLNFVRTLPLTHTFVEENGWIPLKGYNKMDDNTFPNLMAILTGFNQSVAYSRCNPKEVGKLDNCPMLWYDYRMLGYITGYAEDSASIGTFNYRKKGFSRPPVDYYYRPYVLATERLNKQYKDGMVYCTGPETAGERILNLAEDFSVTFKNYSNFGFFWMNSFSHNDVNSPTGMDLKVKEFLATITKKGVLENSIVIFISDHGMRFGPIRRTDTGWLEERLPFIYVSFPKRFKQKYKKEYNNFIINTNRLTSPYDLYMTLQHILVLGHKNYEVKKSVACPTCRSLFKEVNPIRGCSDAGIEQHWCTCAGYKTTTLNNNLKTKISTFMLNEIDKIIKTRSRDHRCAKYSIDKILSTRISDTFEKNETYVLLQIQTHPKALFESTIKYNGDDKSAEFSISGDISRLDSYNEHSKCVSDAYLKKYCYCQSSGKKYENVP